MKKRIENIGSLIESWCMKKLVFAPALLPFGTVEEAYTQTAHLQIAQANPRPKFAKELFLAPPKFAARLLKDKIFKNE